MSNPDSFIEEVTEEVQRDRLFQFFRRYGWVALAVVVLFVAAAAWNEWRKARAIAEAQALGDAVLAALDEPDAAARRSALAAIEVDGPARSVIDLLAAGEYADDPEAARTLLEALAADDSQPQIYRDLAVMKLALLPGNAIPADERIALLESLTTPGRAFRLLAQEQIVLAEVETGDTEAAIARARDVLADGEVTQDLHRRLSQLIVALGGSLDEA